VKAIFRLVSALENKSGGELGRVLESLAHPGAGGSLKGKGVVVTNIGPRSAGAAAGLARGDVLLRYDGTELTSAGTLAQLTARSAGERVIRIDALRGTQPLHFDVPAGKLGIKVNSILLQQPT
jgi:S1-C subfamily serine protease